MSGANPNRQGEAALGDGTLSFFKVLKVVSDIFQPIIPPECYGVYSVLARRDNFTLNPNNSVRELAKAANVSKATASRAIEILVDVGLVKRVRIGGSQPDRYELPSAWEAGKKWGAVYIGRSISFSLSEENAQRLKARVKALQAKQKGTRSASMTSFCVSPEGRQRSNRKRQPSTRETQAGTHLIQKEERTERTPTPTPTPSDSGTTGTEKADPDKDDPDGLLRWVRMKFTGPVNDMRNHLLDTNVPPIPRLRNGYQDWDESGFGHMAIEKAEIRGGVPVLTISAPDPAAARRGLAKYRRIWDESIRRWFEGDVRIELVKA